MDELFRHRNMTEAVFQDVNLRRATFRNVNLSEATIQSANLRNLSIEDADITGLTILGFSVADLIAAERERRNQERLKSRSRSSGKTWIGQDEPDDDLEKVLLALNGGMPERDPLPQA